MTNNSNKLMSGPYASYLTTISILNLQFLLSTQFTDQNTLDWEVNLRTDLQKSTFKTLVDPIVERLTKAPFFLLKEIWLSSISSAIINFTSTTEHYIKDALVLSLQRNSSLRKQAFSEISISGSELENNFSLDTIKLKYFKVIATDKSKGELFSAKFERASKFLGVDRSFLDKKICTMLDSIWMLRNDIAHSNKGFKKLYELEGKTGKFQISKEPSKEEYFDFSIKLLEIMNDFTEYLKDWDAYILEKWPANSFINSTNL